jgi:hypothetical protein
VSWLVSCVIMAELRNNGILFFIRGLRERRRINWERMQGYDGFA